MDLEFTEQCWKCDGDGEYAGLVAYDIVKTPSGKVVSQKTKYDYHIPCECCKGLGWVLTSDGDRVVEFLTKHFDIKFTPKKNSWIANRE